MMRGVARVLVGLPHIADAVVVAYTPESETGIAYLNVIFDGIYKWVRKYTIHR